MKKKAWIVALVAFFAGIVLAITQNKVLPCILTLQEAFDMSMAGVALLSSIFALTAMAVALPASIVMNKIGPKKCGLLAIGFALMGSLLGVFSSQVSTLLVSRIIEGIGVGFIAVVSPALISMWFPAEKRGLPMGVWGSWQMVAQAVNFFVGNSLTIKYGWQGLWWFGIVVLTIALVLFLWKAATPPAEQNYAPVEGDISIVKGLKSKSTWLLSSSMMCFCFSCFGFISWIAPYWSQAFSWDIGKANSYISAMMIIEIIMVVIVGAILDRIPNRKAFGKFAFLFYGVILLFAFRMHNPMFILPFIFIFPFLDGSIPTVCWTLIPQTVEDPENAGVAIGVLNTMQSLGMMLGAPITGYFIENYGWATATIPLAIVMVIGFILFSSAKIYTQQAQPD